MVRTQEERNSEEVFQPSNLDIPGRFPGPNSSIQPDDINRRGSVGYPRLSEALQREEL